MNQSRYNEIMEKRNIFLWTLYDFGNSIPTVVFYLYFSQWLVVDQKVSDLWFNMIFVISTFLLFFTSPIFGSIADKTQIKMPYLRKITFLEILFLLLCSITSLYFAFDFWGVLLCCFFYTLATYFYQLGFTFYDAELSDITRRGNRAFISGLGQAANWLGQFFGVIITLPIITGSIYLFTKNERAETFLPATLIFLVICIPIFLLYQEKKPDHQIKINIFKEYKNFYHNFREMIAHPGIGRFLLGYFLFNDAMITASLNFPIYMQEVYNATDIQKSYILIGTLLASVCGALVTGWFSDRVGLKKSLLGILIVWTFLFPLASLVPDLFTFALLLIVGGFLFGGTWTVTRAVMLYLSPREHINQAFSYYTMAERSSSFVGPIVWGSTIYFLSQYGDLSYRIALLAMAVFIFIGFWIVKSIPDKTDI